MKLMLTNGYPYPYPDGLTDKQQEAISEAAPGRTFELDGVVQFEWKHTVTVEIKDDFRAWLDARRVTGWLVWSEGVLEAPTSCADGYDHPAIIVGDTAYCGFYLLAD